MREETTSDLAQMAQQVYQYYTVSVAAGFEKAEALELAKAYQNKMMDLVMGQVQDNLDKQAKNARIRSRLPKKGRG